MQFIYADPGLTDNLGHLANTCRYVTGTLRRRGIATQVFTFNGIKPDLKAELGAIAHFRAHSFYAPDPDPIFGWLKSFDWASETTREDLHRLPELCDEDVVYLNSAQPPQLMAAVQWLASLPKEKAPHVVVEFGTDPGLDITMGPEGLACTARDPRQDARAAFYRLAGSKMSPFVLSRLHMMTFERRISAIYGALIRQPVGVLPLPQLAVAPLRRRPASSPLTVAVLGHQRADKGYSLMPRIARQLLHERSEIRLLVHNGGPSQMAETQQAMRSLAALERRIVIDERLAGPEVWAELLASTDLMLCPYDPSRFRAAYSAVAVEAVANAIPLVGPASTTIERLIHESGDCGTVFEEFAPNAITAAAVLAIDNFDRHAAAALAAAELWPDQHGPDRLVDAILACAVTKDAAVAP